MQKQRSKKENGWEGRKGRQTRKKELEKGIVPSLDTDVEGRPGHAVGINNEGVKSSQKAGESYAQAAKSCKEKVQAIVRECRRLNQKYHDKQFNLPDWDTLVNLATDDPPASVKDLIGVGSVKRVEDIFDDPEFFEDGPTPQDIRQGNLGNCYFLAALGALGGKPALIEKLCVARDEMVGVYGFVFFRDGEWISEIVDDRLCLRYSDDTAKNPTDFLVVTRGDKNAMSQPLSEMGYAVQRLPKEFHQSLRKSSSALYFGSCRESNETWLPLIEKAYAKAHGDYQSIDGGVTGEGIEDLTGGIASFVRSENVLDKDKLWQELMQVNESFLFGCATRKGRDSESADDEGFIRGHAYTVLAAHEVDVPPVDHQKKKLTKKMKEDEEKRKKEISKDGKIRLLKLHNPWGRQEFNGDWSDSSNRWTPELLKELGHTTGDDGTFFISFLDFLKFFPVIDRIRLIGPEWTITQQWTSVNVPWTTDYLDTSFKLTISKPGPVVLVLSQPDTRYFKGLTGRYKFSLHFRLYKEDDNTYMLRSMEQSGSMRSCNAEVELEPGTYELLLKVTAERTDNKLTPQQAIREARNERREKLLAVGKSFDLIHSKGKLRDLEKQNEVDAMKEIVERAKERLSRHREIKNRQRKIEKKRRRRQKEEVKRKHREKAEIRDENMKKKRQEFMKKQEIQSKNADTEVSKDQNQISSDTDDTGGSDDPRQKRDSHDERPADRTPTQIRTPVGDLGPIDIKDSEQGHDNDQETELPTTLAVFRPEVDEKESEESSSPADIEPEDGKPDVIKVWDQVTPRQDDGLDDRRREQSPRRRTTDHPQGYPVEYEHIHRDYVGPVSHYQGRGPPDGIPIRGLPPGHGQRRNSIGSEGGFPAQGFSSPISSVCDDDFPWDSDIDAPASLASSYDSGSASDSMDEMYPHDPWQATCVVGLRVCSLDENVTIEVVRGSSNKHGHSEIAMGRARSPA